MSKCKIFPMQGIQATMK